ncbi:MAG: nitroreductase family protein [Candidatus Omnitrophica bacterium]|jgi:nitroreductase|nr:nitroreductase family protein [Candidatus Omnitrophota bacterium]MDD3275290.1 nitroreductase family protein [Candidatus Omnitrophota bacterium]MDD5078653.1 nitroreductase family protein [Candidatus Omnitrophota bacterium]MDD5725613.1 nitroreductase family protein [Candidatus Omnitrophota bacterium]
MIKILTAAFAMICIFAGFAESSFAGETAVNPTLRTIFERKSVRAYQPGEVTPEQLMLLVRAGMAAPTAVDRRPWDFIVITDKEVLKKIAAAMPYAKMALEAPAAIVVTGDLNRQFGGKDASFWMLDCSAASENILLAAESMGLGAVWTGVFPDPERIRALRKILGIPENVVPLNFIPVGLPSGKDKPKDKFNPQQIHENHW